MRVRLCMLGVMLFTTTAEAQFARQEVHPFQSADAPAADFLAGKKGVPVTLAGYLRVPKASGKHPTVLLLHGALGVGGYNGSVSEWSRVFNEAGYAAFIVDSWSGRGLQNIAADISRVSTMSRMYDLVGALDAFGDAVERRIDLAEVGGRVFVNNVSLGIYANIVQSPEYRHAKRETIERRLPELLGPGARPHRMQFTDPAGNVHDRARVPNPATRVSR